MTEGLGMEHLTSTLRDLACEKQATGIAGRNVAIRSADGVLGLGGIVGACAGLAFAGAGCIFAPGYLRPLLVVIGLIATGVGGGLVVWGPCLLARFRRSQAAGSVPTLIAFAILYLRLTPTLEGAADFAARAVDGRLGSSLERHRRASHTGKDAFEAFAAEWAESDPSIQRAVSLLVAAVDTPADERAGVLENALEAVLDGSRDRVAQFSSEIKGPATGIYAFGVMLPLALVGMLPVLSTTGGGVPLVLLATGYDLLLPLVLIGASMWLAIRRPAVAAPPADMAMLRRAPPPSRIFGIGALASLTALLAAPVFLPAWSTWVVVAGVGAGSALRVASSPVREHQDRIIAVEDGLPDALAIAGRTLGDGASLERTLGTVSKRLTGPAGTLFERGDRIRRGLGTTVERAFNSDPGALDDVPSQRAETAVELLTIAGEYGAPAGPTLRSVGSYLESLQRVEREARRDLARTTSTLHQTATLFAPAIAGVTVGLATGMQRTQATDAAIDIAALGSVIGGYVLLLAVILPALAVVLARGFDPIRMAFRIGFALLAAAVLYPTSFVAAETLVYI